MTEELRDWARSQPKRSRLRPDGLTNTERDVLTQMCDKVDPEKGGFFYIRLSDFQQKWFPSMAPRTLRGHVTSLVNKEYLILTHRGTGPIGANLRESRSHYYINAGDLVPPLPPEPEQLKLAMLTLIRTEDANNQRQYRTENQPRLGESVGRSAEVLAENQPRLGGVLAENQPRLGEVLAENQPRLDEMLAENQPRLDEKPANTPKVLAENQPRNQHFVGGKPAKTSPDTLLDNPIGKTQEKERGEERREETHARETSSPSQVASATRSNFDPSWFPYLDNFVAPLNDWPLELNPPLTSSELLAMMSDELPVPAIEPTKLAEIIIDNIAHVKKQIRNIDWFIRSRVEMAAKGELKFGMEAQSRNFKKPPVDWRGPPSDAAVGWI